MVVLEPFVAFAASVASVAFAVVVVVVVIVAWIALASIGNGIAYSCLEYLVKHSGTAVVVG